MSHLSLNVVKDHIQKGSPKVDEHSSNGPLDETGSNRCFNLDLGVQPSASGPNVKASYRK